MGLLPETMKFHIKKWLFYNNTFEIKKLSYRKMQCCCSTAIYVIFPHHLDYVFIGRSKILCTGWRWRYSVGGQELLPLKVAPIQPSVTAAFHLQSRRDSDCQMWELQPHLLRDNGLQYELLTFSLPIMRVWDEIKSHKNRKIVMAQPKLIRLGSL